MSLCLASPLAGEGQQYMKLQWHTAGTSLQNGSKQPGLVVWGDWLAVLEYMHTSALRQSKMVFYQWHARQKHDSLSKSSPKWILTCVAGGNLLLASKPSASARRTPSSVRLSSALHKSAIMLAQPASQPASLPASREACSSSLAPCKLCRLRAVQPLSFQPARTDDRCGRAGVRCSTLPSKFDS